MSELKWTTRTLAMLQRFREYWLSLTRYQQGIVIVAPLLALFDLYIKHLTAVSIVMILAVVITLLPRGDALSILKTVEVPGLFKVKFRNDIQYATESLERGGLLAEPATEQKDRASYRQIYDDDPTLSLAALRIDIFRQLRSLAKLAEIDIPAGQRLHWRSLVKELQFRQILTAEAAKGLSDVIPLLDQASRSEEYSKEAADLTIETGPKLIAGLEELARVGGTREFLSGKRSDRPRGAD
jgi:hypothetical protein